MRFHPDSISDQERFAEEAFKRQAEKLSEFRAEVARTQYECRLRRVEFREASARMAKAVREAKARLRVARQHSQGPRGGLG